MFDELRYRYLFLFLSSMLLVASVFGALFSSFGATCFLSSVLLVLLLVYAISRYGFFNPCSIFVLTAAPYLISAPLDIFFFKYTYRFDEWAISWLFVAGTAFLFFFTVGAELRKRRGGSQLQVTPRLSVGVVSFFLMLFAFGYVGIVASLFSLNIGAVTRGEIYGQKPVFFDVYKLFLYPFLMVSLWYLILVRKEPLRRLTVPLLAVAIVLGVDFLVLGDRRAGAMVILAIGYFYSTISDIKLRYWVLFGVVAVLLWGLGLVRNMPTSQWGDIFSGSDYLVVANPSNMEFGAFPLVWQDFMSAWDYEIDFTYLKAFIQLVPSSIFPDRPVPPSVWFVSTFYPDIAAIGGGLAFNAVLESIMNFSIFGPVVVGFFLGWVFSRVSAGGGPINALWGGVLILTFAFFMRNDFVTVLRILLVSGFAASIGLGLFCRVRSQNSVM